MDSRYTRVGYRRLALGLACGFVLAAGAPAAAQAQADKVRFVINLNPTNQAGYERLAQVFTQKTGIEVELVKAPGSQVAKWEQIITHVAGGVSPDVSTASVEFVQYAAKGLLEPLNTYMAADKVQMDGLVPVMTSALRWQGKQYLMPYGASAVSLVYNPSLFAQSGVVPPPNQGGDPAWTWETFVSDMQKLTKRDADGNARQYGLAGAYWDSWITLPYTWGGTWIDSELKHFTGTEPAAVASLQALQDLQWKYHVMGGGTGAFYNGDVAMAGQGSWALRQMIDNPNKLRLAPWFRTGNNPVRGAVNPNGLAMLATAPHKEAAWEFIKFATLDPTGNLLFASAAGSVPSSFAAHRPWLAQMTSQAPDLNIQSLIQLVTEYASIINIRKVTTFNDINRIMGPMAADVLNNKKSAQQALSEVAPSVQALIEQGVQ